MYVIHYITLGWWGVWFRQMLLCPMSVLVLVQSVLEGIHCCRWSFFIREWIPSINYSDTEKICSLKYTFVESWSLPINAPDICNHCTPHLRGWAGDSGTNVWSSELLSSPTVLCKCWACDITQIYPSEIHYYKEQGYDSQLVLTVQGF